MQVSIPQSQSLPDHDAMLVALIIAPTTYSRNKFFSLFENEPLRRARRRAQLVRSVVKDLTEPWPHAGEIPPHPKPVVEEENEQDGIFRLTYSVAELGYRRSVSLTQLEAAALRYALNRAGKSDVTDLTETDRALVEACLAKLTVLPDGNVQN